MNYLVGPFTEAPDAQTGLNFGKIRFKVREFDKGTDKLWITFLRIMQKFSIILLRVIRIECNIPEVKKVSYRTIF